MREQRPLIADRVGDLVSDRERERERETEREREWPEERGGDEVMGGRG